MTGFTLLREGSRDGPFSEDQLAEMIGAGRLDPSTLCVEDGDPTPFFVGELFEDEPDVAAIQVEDDRRPPKTLLVSHPSLLCYFPSLVFGLIAVAVGWWFSAESAWYGFAGITVFSLIFIYAVFERTCHDYVVSEKRVEHISGLFYKSSKEARIVDIRAINVTKQGILGLFGVGTVEFATSGSDGDDVTFSNVWRPHKIKSFVRRLQDA